MRDTLEKALCALREGELIAYPTEFCFGIGCDPLNQRAVERVAILKKRTLSQGFILIAGNLKQVEYFTDMPTLTNKKCILDSWPGTNTWALPKNQRTPPWISGQHHTVALRIPAHDFARTLCLKFGRAIISTSANQHGSPALTQYHDVVNHFPDIAHVVDLPVGSAKSASCIRDAQTNKILR